TPSCAGLSGRPRQLHTDCNLVAAQTVNRGLLWRRAPRHTRSIIIVFHEVLVFLLSVLIISREFWLRATTMVAIVVTEDMAKQIYNRTCLACRVSCLRIHRSFNS